MTNLGTVTIISLTGYGSGGNLNASQMILTDGVTSIRHIIRNATEETDLALTALGFAGVEDTDWMTIR
jgi:hypothetical protein